MSTPTATTSTDTTPSSGWTVVTRRRRPPHFLPSPHSPPKLSTVLNAQPLTYAQVVQAKPPSPPKTITPNQTAPTHNNPATRAARTRNNPATRAAPLKYIRSPHSPSLLRFPPSPHFKEWWGRCFRCARTGHIVAQCKSPRLDFNLTKENRPSHCSTHAQLSPAAPSTHTTPCQKSSTVKRLRAEPTFEEFLALPEPLEDPQMPITRPTKVNCYFNRDDHYFQTVNCYPSPLPDPLLSRAQWQRPIGAAAA